MPAHTTTETPPGPPLADRAPSPAALLFAPDRAMDAQARVGRARGYLAFATASSLLLAGAQALRVDASASTLRRLEMMGQLQSMSDRQVADDTRSAERVYQVSTVAKGLLGAPLSLGLACLALLALAWFFRGRIKGSYVAPVAAATLLPGALADVVDALTALRHAVIPPDGVALGPRTLTAFLELAGRPLAGPWAKIGDAVDAFSLWAALMMAFGLVAAAGVPRRTAIIGTLTAWACYRLLTHVAIGG